MLLEEVKGKKIGVLMGGTSREREISLKSGEACFKALDSKGYRVVAIDVNERLPQALQEAGIEVAFVALHGRLGEDGTVQGLLEVMRIPYTGSGVLASALAMDKVQTKRILKSEGIPTPDYRVLEHPQGLSVAVLEPDFFRPPLVVKPAREGSTLGVSLVQQEKELGPALRLGYQHDRTLLVEKFVPGKEIAAGLLDGETLPLVEIRPKKGHYDFMAKYTAGFTNYIVPAALDESVTTNCQELSTRLYKALDCQGQARVDLILDENNKPYLLELNTVPGMMETSLLPKAAACAGIDFPELVEIILLGASLKASA